MPPQFQLKPVAERIALMNEFKEDKTPDEKRAMFALSKTTLRICKEDGCEEPRQTASSRCINHAKPKV